jgi:hypothetical protein
MLMTAFDARRPTRDVDLSATALGNDPETVHRAVQDVVAIEIDDGLEFGPGPGAARVIREDDDYSGVRVTVPCRLATATVDFHVDVNVGDPIWPGPAEVLIPRVLGGEPLRVRGYPVTMILAEKIVTALQRGTANTRWRDFVDILALSQRHAIDARELSRAIRVVADHRHVFVQLLSLALGGLAPQTQSKWSTWRRRRDMEERTPSSFEEVVTHIAAFADPVLDTDELDAIWDPVVSIWRKRSDSVRR